MAKMLFARWRILGAAWVLFIAVSVVAWAQDRGLDVPSRVPAWNVRGLGPLPWQGIACLDVSADGKRIVVGTIAPSDDPNVVVLDGEGKVVGQHAVGQRWINDVALSPEPAGVFALSTMPAGRNDDFPTVYHCGSTVTPLSASLGEAGYPQTFFHYGEHSNHSGTILRAFAQGSVAVIGDQVQWFANGAAVESSVKCPRPENAVTTSLIVSPSDEALVGCAVRAESENAPANLFLLKRGEKKPLWSRSGNMDVASSKSPEKGPYGKPTLPDGRRDELPQRDERVWAPLSLALYSDATHTTAAGDSDLQLIATADYQGWQRWLRSSATFKDQNYGTRFVPSRPTVTVYDRDGKTVRRFGPELFSLPQWVDLKFLPGGKQLLAWPHHWTARGLAGQPLLPADDDARSLYLLDMVTGGVQRLELPDAVSDVAIAGTGQIVAGCWDGRIYRLSAQNFAAGRIPTGVDVGGPSLVGVSRDGERTVVAVASGVVRIFDREQEVAETDLNLALPHAEKSWVAKATAQSIVPGVWNLPSGRTGGDLGGQRVIQAPDGLILIEAHAGLSFEREWAAIQSAGMDPRQVKYVLPTHEHGDHAPGAYLWRVVTGAQFVCSREMAYSLQHHVPICSGYGFHPPVPTDIVIDEDQELDLAGQKVVALRLPGHTYGAMGWLFRKDGKQLVATGDLIMPDGPLGYAGSVNFSATDVLSSLRKVDALRVDIVLPGHGPWGDPNRYIAAGIDVGRHVGWGKMPPESPDAYFRLTQKNVVVAAWNIDAASSDYGDIDGDGRPDIAVVTPAGHGSAVKIFLNKEGKFSEKPDHEIAVPQVSACHKIRIRHLNDDRTPDFMVSGTGTALLISREAAPQYDVVRLDLNEAHQLRLADVNGRGKREPLVSRAFSPFQLVSSLASEWPRLMPLKPEISGPYCDLRELDFNGDGRTDWLSSYGWLYLRQSDGRIPTEPSQALPPVDPKDWQYMAAGDFNGDRLPDVVLLAAGARVPQGALYLNTGQTDRPFAAKPHAMLDFSDNKNQGRPTQQLTFCRDTPTVADFNGDGIDDLIVGKGQDPRITVLWGGSEGLSLVRSRTIALDYRLQFETNLHVADFNGDGRADLAALGYTATGVGGSGPPAVYVWMQPRENDE